MAAQRCSVDWCLKKNKTKKFEKNRLSWSLNPLNKTCPGVPKRRELQLVPEVRHRNETWFGGSLGYVVAPVLAAEKVGVGILRN